MILIVSIVIGVLVILAVLSPFVVGAGGRLAMASYETSPEQLKILKRTILERYLKDEHSYKSGLLGQRTWASRQQFLTNKYLDASRRLDFLEYQASTSQPAQGST